MQKKRNMFVEDEMLSDQKKKNTRRRKKGAKKKRKVYQMKKQDKGEKLSIAVLTHLEETKPNFKGDSKTLRKKRGGINGKKVRGEKMACGCISVYPTHRFILIQL